MTTTAAEVKNSGIVRIAGQDELLASDVTAVCGMQRLQVSSVEIADNFVTGAVSVGTTPVALRVGAANLTNRKSILIQNLGTTALFVGTSAVTIATGISIPAQGSIVLDLTAAFTVYGVVGTGSNSVRLMELS